MTLDSLTGPARSLQAVLARPDRVLGQGGVGACCEPFRQLLEAA